MHKIRRDLVSKLVKYQIGNDGRQHAAYASERGTQSDRGTSGTSGKQLCRVREDHIEIAGCEELADQRAQHLIDVRICVRTHSPVSITHKQKKYRSSTRKSTFGDQTSGQTSQTADEETTAECSSTTSFSHHVNVEEMRRYFNDPSARLKTGSIRCLHTEIQV